MCNHNSTNLYIECASCILYTFQLYTNGCVWSSSHGSWNNDWYLHNKHWHHFQVNLTLLWHGMPTRTSAPFIPNASCLSYSMYTFTVHTYCMCWCAGRVDCRPGTNIYCLVPIDHWWGRCIAMWGSQVKLLDCMPEIACFAIADIWESCSTAYNVQLYSITNHFNIPDSNRTWTYKGCHWIFLNVFSWFLETCVSILMKRLFEQCKLKNFG